jgi:phenylalanyl-tRNA synthetase beta chain
MIISLNWLKKFTDIDLPVDELATLVGARLVEIEKTIDFGVKFQGAVVAKIIECAPLENTDHLNVTKIDDGGVTKDVERDEKGLVTVVCGAPNVRAGLTVAWLPPGSTVPATFNDAEPFVLSAKNLRGTVSNGMLASAKELDLFDDHTGILELDESTKPGDTFEAAYELDDYLLDIENKSLTHRPDTFGIVGFAREIAGISGKSFQTPNFLKLDTTMPASKPTIETLTVTIDDPTLSDRYQAVVLSGAKQGAEAPLSIRTYLARSGVRPINGIVDITNMLMLASGQPLHAFDYDKLIALNNGHADIHVRAGRGEGDTLRLLDGRIVTLVPEDIVIANGDTAVALAGAMGGSATEIDEHTKNIIVESATFNLYNLRATQMRHGIFSEAITRFTKGQPAELTSPVLIEAARLATEWTGAVVASAVVDAYPGKHETTPISIAVEMINRVLGSNYSAQDVVKTLRNVEFIIEEQEGIVNVTAPYWRQDIHIAEDVIEEVGRLNGFDTITPTLPARDFTAVMPASLDIFKTKIRKLLVRAGANEVLTYSFVHGDVLVKSQLSADNSYRITNAISPDLQYYRQSLTPSLLGLIHPNIKQGYGPFAIFEINKAHPKSLGLSDENVPIESDMLAFVVASKKVPTQAPYYQAKRFVAFLVSSLGLNVSYALIESEDDSYMQPFEPKRSAVITEVSTGRLIGIVGEYKRSVERGFKLPSSAAGFELNIAALGAAYAEVTSNYTPLSRFPSVERDICFQSDVALSYGTLIDAVRTGLSESQLNTTIAPVDIYQAEGSATKNTTIRITLNSEQNTLTSEDVTQVINMMVTGVSAKLSVTVI